MRRSVVVIVSFALLVAACTGGSNEPPSTTSSTSTTTTLAPEPRGDLPWWNDRVFYEVFVRSFRDSDGDGIGDFAGLTGSLDYLNDGDPATTDDLGVTGIWLMPIFPSPSYHGYDVTDYRDINPDYGTMDDFTAFLDAAHERGIAVLIDLVINHSSREHPWFTASANGDPTYEDWYLWSETNPGTVAPWGAPAWHPQDGRYYFGLFWEGMPDLNLENQDVTTELEDTARFWLEDVGVDGFRLDAARHLIEDGDIVSDTPATVAWLEGFNDFVDSIAPDALVLGEVWSPTENVATYIPEALDLAFEFDLSGAGAEATEFQRAEIFTDAMTKAQAVYPELQYATFLTNHDMDRIMSVVEGEVAIAKLAATWLLTSAGVPFVYYGEEVGLQGVKPDERIRTPMPWTGEAPGLGFTKGTPWEPAFEGYDEFNVALQTDDPGSLLSHYRSLIQYRVDSVAMRRGDLVMVPASADTVMGYLRTVGDQHVLVVMNLAPTYATDYTLDLPVGPLAGFAGVQSVVGPQASAPTVNTEGGFTGYQPLESIPPYGFLVLEFTEEPSPEPPVTTTTSLASAPAAATTADVAVMERFYQLYADGGLDETESMFSPDARVMGEDGEAFAIVDPLPREAGLDDTWDWDGDGIVTVADLIRAQDAFLAIILTSFDVECLPAGPWVLCDIDQGDLFREVAGLEASTHREQWRLVDGLIVEFGQQIDPEPPDVAEAWLEQFAAYEAWVAEARPDAYPIAFRGPCCAGTPEGMYFTPDSIEIQRELIPAWVASLD